MKILNKKARVMIGSLAVGAIAIHSTVFAQTKSVSLQQSDITISPASQKIIEAGFTFPRLVNYCATHDCSSLPVKTAPTTILVIHGMTSSMDSQSNDKPYQNNGNYVRLLSLLTDLQAHDPNLHVYGIDYNSSGASSIKPASHVNLVSLNTAALATTCKAGQGWTGCWNTIESGPNVFTPQTLTIRSVSNDLRTVLINAVKDGKIPKDQPITVIAHSMGGLVVRDLLYNSEDATKTGYELLKENGVWINEYISLGTPHIHGLVDVDNIQLITLIQSTNCATVGFIKNLSVPNMAYQFCMLEQWTDAINNQNNTWQDGKRLTIDKVDFPQIHWVYAAGLGQYLIQDPETPADGLVDYRSATNRHITPRRPGDHTADNTVRADQYIYINEYPYTGNLISQLNLNVDPHNNGDYAGIPGAGVSRSPIPGQKGQPNRSAVKPYSGFGSNANVTHSALVNVGYYYGGSFMQYKPCTFTGGSGGADDLSGIAGCVGYFQYVIPQTTLCLLPGYISSVPYFNQQKQFYPPGISMNPVPAGFGAGCDGLTGFAGSGSHYINVLKRYLHRK